MQGNIHISDGWQPGKSVFSRARRGISSPIRARSWTLEPPEPTSEDLAKYLDELRRINGAGEANWTRVLLTAHDEVGNASHAALRRLGAGAADVLLRRRRIKDSAEAFYVDARFRGQACAEIELQAPHCHRRDVVHSLT